MKIVHTSNCKKLLVSSAIGALLISVPGIAMAQSANQGEIIVTATKRATTIQDAPISIAVVTGEFIEDYNIVDLSDLQGFVPNLAVQKTFGNWAVRVRGLGSGVSNIAFDSSVSIFNDGIYCGRSRCLELGYMDAGNVEVARGPQGALFGKSTVAGAISVSSARPTEESKGYLTVGTELEHGGYLVNGAISGPTSDSLRLRLAAQYKDLDGDMDNLFLGTEDHAQQNFAIRASAEWDISPDIELWAKYETGNTDITGNRIQLVAPGALASPNSPNNPATRETVLDDIKYVSTGVGREEFDNSNQTAFTTQLDANIFDGHKLSIIGGHSSLDYENHVDVDGVPEPFLNTRLFEDYSQDSIEARLLSPSGKTIEYIIGAMFHKSDTVTRQHSPFFPGFFKSVGVPGFVVDGRFGAAGAQAVGLDRKFQRETETLSIYGQLSWNPTDQLSVTGDLRYTDEKQEGQASGEHLIFADGFTPTLFPGAPFQANPEFVFRQTRSDDSLDPSIRLLYELNDQINVYAAYSKGSKPGGLKANDGALGTILLAKAAADPNYLQQFAGVPTLARADLVNGVTLAQGNGVFDFEDESANNYEIGTKMILSDGRATLNATAFWTDFENLQTSVFDGATLAFIIGNAASARIKGVELEATYRASDKLSFTASGAYTDAKFKDYEGTQCTIGEDHQQEDPACTSGLGSLSGRRIERAPETEFNIGAAWESDISSNLRFLANVDLYHSGNFFVRQDFDPHGFQESYFKLNGRIGVATADDWQLTLVGRNLTDERTIQHAFAVISEFASVSAGRSIFLEATKKF